MRLVSTRDAGTTATFKEAVLSGIAPGGGLWMPETLPVFPDWPALLEMDWAPRCELLMDRLLGDEMDREALARAVLDAFNFPLPLAAVRPGVFALELFHGPTLAFKDFGARFFAAVLDLVRDPARPVTILTATSGDTGAAVAQAFWKREGVRAVVLYPRGRVSDLQERQFSTLGENVTALSVDGSFDDCQALVKAAFADADLTARHGLTSANSINVARLFPQMLYYVEAVAALRRQGIAAPPVIAVPSGNFGNLSAGLMIRAMGLPVESFVAATNANDTVPEYLDTGTYRPRASVATLSNAMDVGAPNNWERIEHLFAGEIEALRRVLRWGRKTDAETEEAIRSLRTRGYLADPHAAVAYAVLADRLAPEEISVFLGTAHPAKFLPVYERLGIEVPIPEELSVLLDRPLLAREVPNELGALVEALEGG
ncbi:MAG: threonine synthase [Thermoanaerobaculia bacterium]